VVNSYFNKDLSTSASPLGRTTQEMANQETYQDLDFEGVWEFITGAEYPTLRALRASIEINEYIPNEDNEPFDECECYYEVCEYCDDETYCSGECLEPECEEYPDFDNDLGDGEECVEDECEDCCFEYEYSEAA
jgi:hypothetical protein